MILTRLTDTRLVRAPAKQVWAILADIATVSSWNPNITRSYLLPGTNHGPGAARHCDVEGGYFRERVSEWREGDKLAFQVTETNAPVRAMTGTFLLREAAEGTEVEFVIDYDMKLGVLGKLLDRLVMRRQLDARLPRVLDGLKREAEGTA